MGEAKRRRARAIEGDAKHEDFYQDLLDLLDRHAGKLPVEHMLAVSAKIVGGVTAHQNQLTMSKGRAAGIIKKNIELGNREAVQRLLASGSPTKH